RRVLERSHHIVPDGSSTRSAATQRLSSVSSNALAVADSNVTNTPATKTLSIPEISAAIDAALTNRLFKQRAELLQQIAEMVAPADIPRALMLAGRIPAGPLRAEFLSPLIVAWAEHDPRAALEFARAMANISERSSAISDVLNAWARTDVSELMN